MVHRALFSLVAMAFAAGCASNMPSDDFPAREMLAARVTAYWDAWARDDYRGVYEQESPQIRRSLTYEAWLKDRRLDRPNRVNTIVVVDGRLVETCGCAAVSPFGSGRRCTAISEVVSRIGGKTLTERAVESWDYVDGAWYHAYTTVARACPGGGAR